MKKGGASATIVDLPNLRYTISANGTTLTDVTIADIVKAGGTMKTKPTPTEKFKSYYEVTILKSKEERTDIEDLMLTNLYWLAEVRKYLISNRYQERNAASIETLLILEGVVDANEPLKPVITEEKFLGFTIKDTEPYNKIMERMAIEYLKEKGVLA